MGTASITVSNAMLNKILELPLNQYVIALSWGEETEEGIQVHISSSYLPDGYNGQQEMWINKDGKPGFRRETDT